MPQTQLVPGVPWPPGFKDWLSKRKPASTKDRDLQEEITVLLISKGEMMAASELRKELGVEGSGVSNALTALGNKKAVVRIFRHGVWLYSASAVIQTSGREVAQRVIHCVTVSPGVTFTELKELVTTREVTKVARRLEAYGKLVIKKEPCQCCGTVIYRCYLKGMK